MDINLIFKIAGLGIFISIINIVLKQADKEEQAQMLTWNLAPLPTLGS